MWTLPMMMAVQGASVYSARKSQEQNLGNNQGWDFYDFVGSLFGKGAGGGGEKASETAANKGGEISGQLPSSGATANTKTPFWGDSTKTFQPEVGVNMPPPQEYGAMEKLKSFGRGFSGDEGFTRGEWNKGRYAPAFGYGVRKLSDMRTSPPELPATNLPVSNYTPYSDIYMKYGNYRRGY